MAAAGNITPQPSPQPLKLGIDYGGVCSIHSSRYEAADGNHEAPEAINMPGCLEALQTLKAQGHQLILVSFCGDRRAQSTAKYLQPLGLFDQLYFVKHRGYKADICRLLGLDVLIDDRADILKTVAPTQTLQFAATGSETEPDTYKCKKTGRLLKTVPFRADWTCGTWAEVLETLPQVKALALKPDPSVAWKKLCHHPRQ